MLGGGKDKVSEMREPEFYPGLKPQMGYEAKLTPNFYHVKRHGAVYPLRPYDSSRRPDSMDAIDISLPMTMDFFY